jgi:hypothetical protein
MHARFQSEGEQVGDMKKSTDDEQQVGKIADLLTDGILETLRQLLLVNKPKAYEKADHFVEITWTFQDESGQRMSIALTKPYGNTPVELLALHAPGMLIESESQCPRCDGPVKLKALTRFCEECQGDLKLERYIRSETKKEQERKKERHQ